MVGNQSKEEVVKVLGLVLGVLVIKILVGILSASFVTFVIGLFVVYEFTALNVFKVWLAIAAVSLVFRLVTSK